MGAVTESEWDDDRHYPALGVSWGLLGAYRGPRIVLLSLHVVITTLTAPRVITTLTSTEQDSGKQHSLTSKSLLTNSLLLSKSRWETHLEEPNT